MQFNHFRLALQKYWVELPYEVPPKDRRCFLRFFQLWLPVLLLGERPQLHPGQQHKRGHRRGHQGVARDERDGEAREHAVQRRAVHQAPQPLAGPLEKLHDGIEHKGEIGPAVQGKAQNPVADKDARRVHLHHKLNAAAVGGRVGVADAQQLGQYPPLGVHLDAGGGAEQPAAENLIHPLPGLVFLEQLLQPCALAGLLNLLAPGDEAQLGVLVHDFEIDAVQIVAQGGAEEHPHHHHAQHTQHHRLHQQRLGALPAQGRRRPHKGGDAVQRRDGEHDFGADEVGAHRHGDEGPGDGQPLPPGLFRDGGQGLDAQADGKRRGERDDAAHLVGGEEPAVEAVARIGIGEVAGAGEDGQQDDAGVQPPRRADGPGGHRKAVLPVNAVQKHRHKGGEEGLHHLLNVGNAQPEPAQEQHIPHEQRQVGHQRPGVNHAPALALKPADKHRVEEARRHEQRAHHHPGGDGVPRVGSQGGEHVDERLAQDIHTQDQHQPLLGKFLDFGAKLHIDNNPSPSSLKKQPPEGRPSNLSILQPI